MADSETVLNLSGKEDSEEATDNYILRCRGLPYSVTVDDLKKFFSACSIASVYLAQGQDGRSNGEAFLEIEDEESFDAGLKMNKEHIGKRYIEVFESDRQEMDYQMKKYTQSSSGAEGVIRLRGLPFSCTKDDITNFFKGKLTYSHFNKSYPIVVYSVYVGTLAILSSPTLYATRVQLIRHLDYTCW